MLFRLLVYLRVERSKELSLEAKKIAKRGQELGCKNRSAITDDRVREAVILHHYVDNYFC